MDFIVKTRKPLKMHPIFYLCCAASLACTVTGIHVAHAGPAEDAAIKRLNRVVKIVLHNYVDPLKPADIIPWAVKGIERDHGPTGLIEAVDGGFELKRSGALGAYAAADGLEEVMAGLRTLHRICGRMKPDASPQAITESAIQGILRQLDPHCTLLLPEELRQLQDSTRGHHSGIGVVITMRDGMVTVVSAIEGTPAWRAGLQTGDRILKADGSAIADLSQAIRLLSGPTGSTVPLVIARHGKPEPIDLLLVREENPTRNLFLLETSPGIVYVRVTHFLPDTASRLRKKLSSYPADNGGLKGIMLDFRDNPGGLLIESIKTADLFLDEGAILHIRGRFAKMTHSYFAKPPAIARDVPLVVLISGGSASASEIVAGALQDNRRGVVIGESSFGKGTVQSVDSIDGGYGLKITIARYFTPDGHLIEPDGIIPDITTESDPLPQASRTDSLTIAKRSTVQSDSIYGERLRADSVVLAATRMFRSARSSDVKDLIAVAEGAHAPARPKRSEPPSVSSPDAGQSAALGVDQKRLALLIGNSVYAHGGTLKNPVNDIDAVERTLGRIGFEVISRRNADQTTIKRAIDRFGRELADYAVGLFYYAGHGVQVDGINYLIPVDARLDSKLDVEYDCVRVGRVLAKMENAANNTNIVILDACRDNPFERSWNRSAKGRGLAFMNAPTGSLIAYATSPGRTAMDGRGRHSPYASALLSHLATPQITILEMFQRVRNTVISQSNGQQVPWESTSLRGNFYFIPSVGTHLPD
jgi:C-terminal peptidase prc